LKVTIRAEFEETDPRVVAAYQAARRCEAAFTETLSSVAALPIPGGEREAESLRRITLYLGGLFSEMLAASIELAIHEMPRAQHVLNRQLLEYLAHNRWFMEYPAAATDALDRLPKTVYLEVTADVDAFDQTYVEEITRIYRDWANEHKELDETPPQPKPSITQLVKLTLQPGELFWYYGLPSIIVHGQIHGLQDVLGKRPDGTIERSLNSRHLDRVEELRRATGFALHYALLIAINFDLSITNIRSAERAFAEALKVDGVAAESIPVQNYRHDSH
jgi:hypothetical protein